MRRIFKKRSRNGGRLRRPLHQRRSQVPKKLHDKLEKQARKKGLKGKRKKKYVYGGMRRSGWVPNRER